MDGHLVALIGPLFPFAVSMSVTPGPNNVMVTAAAANFGARRTLPHMLGITFGFPLMIVAIGWGLGGVFAAYPAVHAVLHYVGAAYMLFLAYRIAVADRGNGNRALGAPITFLQAALFQWINPKAWVIAIGAVTTYTTVGGNLFVETMIIGAVFAVVCFPSVAIWALFGQALAGWLRSDGARRAFNYAMAVLLVLSLVPIFL